jgi:hypothetical protein
MPFSFSHYTVIYLLQIASKFIYGYMIMQPFYKTEVVQPATSHGVFN